MKFILIFPDTWAKTLWPFSNSTRNIAFGRASTTLACSLIESFFAMNIHICVKYQTAGGFHDRPAALQPAREPLHLAVRTSQPPRVTAIVCSK